MCSPTWCYKRLFRCWQRQRPERNIYWRETVIIISSGGSYQTDLEHLVSNNSVGQRQAGGWVPALSSRTWTLKTSNNSYNSDIQPSDPRILRLQGWHANITRNAEGQLFIKTSQETNAFRKTQHKQKVHVVKLQVSWWAGPSEQSSALFYSPLKIYDWLNLVALTDCSQPSKHTVNYLSKHS